MLIKASSSCGGRPVQRRRGRGRERGCACAPSRDRLGASHGVWAAGLGVGPFVEGGSVGLCERVGKPEVGTRLTARARAAAASAHCTHVALPTEGSPLRECGERYIRCEHAILTLPHSTLTHHRQIMISGRSADRHSPPNHETTCTRAAVRRRRPPARASKPPCRRRRRALITPAPRRGRRPAARHSSARRKR